MRLARSGWPFLIVPAVLAAITLALGAWPLAAGLLLVALYMAYFFRDPERKSPEGAALVLAPGDGRVMGLRQQDDGRWVLAIFLGLLDVHVNRAPADGTVTSVEALGRGYVAAYRADAHEHNVRNHAVFATAAGDLAMDQIVGFAARRLEFWKRPGESVRAGERIGLMKFGSRIDLLLPQGSTVRVRHGDRVTAGVTVIAEMAPPPAPQGGPASAEAASGSRP